MLAVSALAKNNHNNNNAKANATDSLVAASVIPSYHPIRITTVLTMLAQGVNAAANNGAKGDTAAALAQEAVDEFEAGQAVTAVGAPHHSLYFLLYQPR